MRIRRRDVFWKKQLCRSWRHGCFFLLVLAIFCTLELALNAYDFSCLDFSFIISRILYGAGSGLVCSFEKHLASGSARIGIDTNYTNCDTGTVPVPILSTYICVISFCRRPPPPPPRFCFCWEGN
jgi:hypothetical protein